MRDELTQLDIQEWRAYFELEPAGPISDYYRNGILAALLFNANRAKEAAARGPKDYMPPAMLEEPEPQGSTEENVRQVFSEMGQAFKSGAMKR